MAKMSPEAKPDTYNARITELQTENDRIRGTYESRLEELLKNTRKNKQMQQIILHLLNLIRSQIPIWEYFR